jgi:hypothetical protein
LIATTFDVAPFQRRTMPNGTVVFYRDSDHSYFSGIHEVNGNWCGVQSTRLVAVSTILRTLAKDALLDWAADLARVGEDWREVRGKAATRGTGAHDLVVGTLLKKRTSLADLPEKYRPWGQAAYRWLAHANPKVEAAEQVVVSTEHRYAGRFDLFTADGIRIDFKTVTRWAERNGKRLPPYPENVLQLDLYEQAAVESGFPAADVGMIVRLGPDGTYDETPVNPEPERGLAVLGAYRARAAAIREVA